MIQDTQSAQISQKQDERNIYVIMKRMCPPGYHHNGFVVTHALGHMMYGYTLLVLMNQRVLNKLSKEQNISGHMGFPTHRSSVKWSDLGHKINSFSHFLVLFLYIFLTSKNYKLSLSEVPWVAPFYTR